MGDLGDYWRDVKAHYRNRTTNRPLSKKQKEVRDCYARLIARATVAGDHHRIGTWDFWFTGTVRNYKTGEYLSLTELEKRIDNPDAK